MTSKPHAYSSSHSHSVLLSAVFHLEEMKASEKETGLKRLRSPASRPLFSHCACPAEPVLEQSPPAAGPKSSSQRETPATICERRRDVQGLECSSVLRRRGEGLVDSQPTSAAPARAQQLSALRTWDSLAHAEQKSQRRSHRVRSEEATVLESNSQLALDHSSTDQGS